jgi:hypothetical protein
MLICFINMVYFAYLVGENKNEQIYLWCTALNTHKNEFQLNLCEENKTQALDILRSAEYI